MNSPVEPTSEESFEQRFDGYSFLPEFDRLTDADAMGWLLQRRLAGFSTGDIEIAQCQVVHARYKTFVRPQSRHKSYLALCYELAVNDKNGKPLGTQLLYAKAFADGKSAARFRAAQSAPLAPPRCGDALAHLPDLDMVLWAFPNDPALPHLAELADPRRLLGHLPYGSLPPPFAAAGTQVSMAVIHYYPEERCTARYLLTAPSGASLALIGKTYRDEHGREVQQRMETLREIAQRCGDFAVAEPLGYDAALKTVWQKEMPGVALRQRLTLANSADWLGRVAQGLASLHRNMAVSAPRDAASDPTGDLANKVEKLSHAFPEFVAKLQLLERALRRRLAVLSDFTPAFIHGDFHLRQLLVHDDRVIFLDFDECGGGDPLQDVASFMVDLYFYDFSAAEAARMGEAFWRAYRRHSGGSLSQESLHRYLARQFFTKAYRAYRQHRADRQAQVAWLLDRAARHAQLAEGQEIGAAHD